jgi:RNase P subunit RPR2
MSVSPASLRGKRFSSWQVLGRSRSNGKGACVTVRCRHCGNCKRLRVRALLTGSYKPCGRCFDPRAGLVKDIASNPHTKYDPTNTKNEEKNV